MNDRTSRRVTLAFLDGEQLTEVPGSLAESTPTTLTVAVTDAGALPAGRDASIVAIVHPPRRGAGAAFVMTTRLPDLVEGQVRLARIDRAD